ncbi:hypothetical protein GQR36_03105 [Enterococcus termitis]
MNYTVNVDYSEYVARKEADQLAEEKMNQTMPTLLAEIVTESEGTIVKIDKKRSSYKSLLVTVPLTVKYERNGEKKNIWILLDFLFKIKQPIHCILKKSRSLILPLDMKQPMNF